MPRPVASSATSAVLRSTLPNSTAAPTSGRRSAKARSPRPAHSATAQAVK